MTDTFSSFDAQIMHKAISLAYIAKGQTSPNPAVGAVIVKNKKIIGEGYHKKAGLNHAEIDAIKNSSESVKGASIYVTLEPCSHFGKTPPCTDAIIKSGIKEVIAAMKDPFPKVSGSGFAKLRDNGVKVRIGLLEEKAQKLNEDFIVFHTEKRPFIHLKYAMTIDGKTSSDSGDSKWISNELSREYVHKLRSYCDAVLIGGNTFSLDNPELNVRLKGYKGKQPLRIILDDKLNFDPGQKIFNSKGGKILIITSQKALEKNTKKINAEVITMKTDKNGILIPDLLDYLRSAGIQSVFAEGGRKITGSFLANKTADKITVFIAPKILGGKENKSPVITPYFSSQISDAIILNDIKIMNFDNDICIEGYPKFK